MRCLDDDQVLAYVRRELRGAALEEVEAHLDACSACRILTSELALATGSDATFSGATIADPPTEAGAPVLDGRFEVGAVAGVGGMGRVCFGMDRTTRAPVAIKFLTVTSAGDLPRFQREVQLLKTLAHPGIVRYLAHGTTDQGEPYLVMEWLEGETLRTRLAVGPLDVADTLALGRGIAEALAVAHRAGIVHRDLKPSNIFLRDRKVDRPVLLDFGLAVSESDRRTGARITMSGAIVGTPGYMAPEQALGDRLDPRADVFSLGCVLYRCLTGRSLFDGDDVLSVVLKTVLHDGPIVELPVNLPERFANLLGRMLARSKTGRPEDASRVAAELAAIRPDDEPASRAAPTSFAGISWREQRVVVLLLVQVGEAEELTVASLASRAGARFDLLPDGTAVVAFQGAVAGDLAALAARTALAVARAFPDAPIALVSGRDRDLAERGAELLGVPLAGVRVDALTAGLLAPRFHVRSDDQGLALIAARGPDDPPRRVRGRFLPFTGRERAVALVERSLLEVIEQRVGRALVVSGPPGIGKSRLRAELVAWFSSRAPAPDLWLASGDPAGAAVPYALASALLAQAVGARDASLDHRLARLSAAVRAVLPPNDAALAYGPLGELLGAPPAEGPRDLAHDIAHEPTHFAERARRAFAAFVTARAAARPIALLIDEIEHADQATIDLLGAVVRGATEVPLLAVAFGRPEALQRFPSLFADAGVTHVPLTALGKRAAADLVRHALGDAMSADATEAFAARAEGNPLLLEELIESWGGPPSPAVVAHAEARTATLDEAARRVLRAASVNARGVDLALLATVLGVPSATADLARRVDELVDRGVLERDPQGGDALRFRSELARIASYSTLAELDRRLAHRLAGEYFEAAGAPPEELADHFERAGDLRRAFHWFRTAAEAALADRDFARASELARRAIACDVSGEERGALDVLAAPAPHE